jgi:hypothetical protein
VQILDQVSRSIHVDVGWSGVCEEQFWRIKAQKLHATQRLRLEVYLALVRVAETAKARFSFAKIAVCSLWCVLLLP